MNFFNNVFSVDDAMKQGDTPVDLPCTSDDGTPMSPGDTNIWELPTPRGDEAPVIVGPFANWKVANKYKILRTIGKGSYGEVVEATDERNASQRVAIKRILKIFDSETDAKRIYREMYILRRLNHPNVVALRNVFTGNPLNSPVYSPGIASQPLTPGLGMKNLHLDTTPRKRHRPRAFSIDHSLDDLYLVFDFVDTDLQKLIHSAQYLSSAHVKTFLYQMLVALKYIHSANVIHRDIKPANILLYEDCRLKLCDFGLARIVSSDVATAHTPKRVPVPTGTSSVSNVDDDAMPLPVSRQLTRHVVTRWYRAPELILLSEYTGAVDMWSVGCVFAELLGMQAEIIRDYQDRTALFPGMSCPSLSGDGLEDAAARRRGYRETEIDRSDQLNVILRTLGSPSEEDLEAFGSEHAKRVLRNQPYYAGGGLPNRFKMASRNALDLLQRMLQFNPNKRITVEEALSHRYLSEVRDISMETTMEQGLNVNFETPPLVGELLRKKMKEEIESYEKH